MSHPHWSDRMSAYLDGELSDRDRAAADEHFRLCDACRSERDDFEAIRRVVRGPAGLRATSDPWPAIAAEIGPAHSAATWLLRRAAAILLPVAMGVGAWLAFGRGGPIDSPVTTIRTPAIERADEGFRAEVAALEVRFRQVEGELDPRTVDAIRKGLADLDAALTQAERELEQDSGNRLLASLVERARQQKLRLLRSVDES